MFYEIVIKLCAQKGISLTSLMTEELHMSSGNITRWKSGTVPGSRTLQKIADYFNVSTDYLLGNEQKNKPAAENDELDPKDKEIFMKLNMLNSGNRDVALALIESLLKNQEQQ